MIKTLMTKIREFVTRGVTGTALSLELETGEERGGPVRETAMWADPRSGAQQPIKKNSTQNFK
jgi:hypothetical protein